MRREASPTVFVCAVAASANRCSVTQPTCAQYSAASALLQSRLEASSLVQTVSASRSNCTRMHTALCLGLQSAARRVSVTCGVCALRLGG